MSEKISLKTGIRFAASFNISENLLNVVYKEVQK